MSEFDLRQAYPDRQASMKQEAAASSRPPDPEGGEQAARDRVGAGLRHRAEDVPLSPLARPRPFVTAAVIVGGRHFDTDPVIMHFAQKLRSVTGYGI